MKIDSIGIKRLLSDVSKKTIQARTPEYKIAVYEYLRSKGVPEHKAVKKAAGVRYDKFMKLYEARKPLQKLKRILTERKKTPFIKQYKTLVTRIPAYTARTYTESGEGELLYQLIVSGNYRNEKTGNVEYQNHGSHAKPGKDFDEHFEDALSYNPYKDTNWILIMDKNDPDYVKIKIIWRRYGGKKGISPWVLAQRRKHGY